MWSVIWARSPAPWPAGGWSDTSLCVSVWTSAALFPEKASGWWLPASPAPPSCPAAPWIISWETEEKLVSHHNSFGPFWSWCFWADANCAAGGATFLHNERLEVKNRRLHELKHLLNESLAVVYADPQILVLLQDVDDLILQSQILLHLRIMTGNRKQKKKKKTKWKIRITSTWLFSSTNQLTHSWSEVCKGV